MIVFIETRVPYGTAHTSMIRERLNDQALLGSTMKTRNAPKIFALTIGVLLLSLSIANLTTASNDPRTNSDPNRQFLVGTGFLCSIPSPPAPALKCPDVATSSNTGDKVYVAGSGSFNPNPSGQATGGGSFVHLTSGGALVGFGTWTAEELISFTPAGFNNLGGLVPLGSEAGIAVLKVHLSPATGGPGFTAILSIYCKLGFSSVPFEGITLNVIGGPNFDTHVSGITTFIKE